MSKKSRKSTDDQQPDLSAEQTGSAEEPETPSSTEEEGGEMSEGVAAEIATEEIVREAPQQPVPRSSKPSIWPLVLAIALVTTFIGMAVHPIMLGIGVVLLIVAIMGWALERR